VNDTYGHLAGDEVLKLVAKTIRDCVRETDFPARYGGEEFVVIIPNASLEDLNLVAERVDVELAPRKRYRSELKVI